MKFDLQHTAEILQLWLKDHLPKISAETLGWLAAIVIHAATIPTLLALMTGLSDRTPSLDIVLFMWAGLVLLFLRAVVLKDNYSSRYLLNFGNYDTHSSTAKTSH